MSLETQDISRPPLRGRLLVAVQAIWVSLAALTSITFILSVILYFRHIGSLAAFYQIYPIAFDALQVVVFFAAAAAIFWRRFHDPMVAFISIALLMFGAATVDTVGLMTMTESPWRWMALVVQALGLGLTLVVLYTFPDGRFIPRWAGVLTLIWIGWLIGWTFSPIRSFDPETLPLPFRYLIFMISSDPQRLKAIFTYIHYFSLLLILLCWFGTGVFAQIYRYIKVSNQIQRQQTKWVVFGVVFSFIGYFAFQLLVNLPQLNQPGAARFLLYFLGKPLSTFLFLLMPLTISLSILRRRLWDIDPIIKRTMVYGLLTSGVAAIYLGIVFSLQRLFRLVTGQQSDVAIVVATLVSASLAQPIRRRVQAFIDHRFYRERVDFRRAITTFSREVRTIIELPELLRVLVRRTTELLHIQHGAVFLRGADGDFKLAEAHNLPSERDISLKLIPSLLGPLWNGHAVAYPQSRDFSLLVPLIAPREEQDDLVGVLALGPRLSGQDYAYEDRTLLLGLADQAGTAIYVARLIQEKQAEAERREAAERRLDAHRNSPAGRAEAFAQNLMMAPERTLIELHRLTQDASQDASAARLLDNLPNALNRFGALPLTKLAEGFHYLFTSQSEPEMLAVGLRTLITQLSEYPEEGLHYVCRWNPDSQSGGERERDVVPGKLLYGDQALSISRLCQAALEVKSIAQITQLLPFLQSQAEEKADEEKHAAQSPTAITTVREPFQTLPRAMRHLYTAAEALRAYERVEASRDKLSYLVSAVERLRHVDHVAQAELSGIDRPITQQIAESWLAIVTGAISELQTRAELTYQLLTRHTWQEDAVPLVLVLRNEGRGAAINLQVNLVPKQTYTVLSEGAQVDQLAPGEEARVELRVRPRLEDGVNQFSARFVIAYTDPRGPDQIEHFADVVRLLAGDGEFQFIPNPYVLGTPLEAGSPLFFGREDVVVFIEENLAAQHRNNLVLIGQRRTGKTSLLKQLPVRLGDDCLPVYLDGQALGLDPGLPNFFLALATEITFALEDRGFDIAFPEYEDFVESPTAAFERRFLTSVREAIGRRHLLIMFDEFEELETAVEHDNLPSTIFGFLRHLIQHVDNLSVIFCGTHRLEELASDYWSVLFNISLYRQIAYLEQAEALRLIQEPVAEYNMQYDDLALDKMWQVTAGHPYFLQLLCHSLVNQHNRTERNYVTVGDVNNALDEILASGEAHFMYLWTDAGAEERLVLAALSRMMPLTGHAKPVQIVDYLKERGAALERRAVGDALHRLALRHILTASSAEDPILGDSYRWRLGLLGLWVEKYRSISRAMEEVASLDQAIGHRIDEVL